MTFVEDSDTSKFFEPKNELDYTNGTFTNPRGESATSGIRIICVVLLRIGFILVQVGSIPVESVYLIIFRNLIEIATTIFSYSFIGFYLSFGRESYRGIVNYKGSINDDSADLSSASLGFSACLLGTAINSSVFVARLHQFPMLLLSFLTSSILIPILMCWCWTSKGWMTKALLMEERVSIKDYGGNLTVHVPSAVIGLIGALFLGRRIMKLKDVDRFSLGSEYASGIVTGYFLIIVGHIGFYLPSPAYEAQHSLKDHISLVSVNSLMAVGAGILLVSLVLAVIARDIYRYWIIVKCLQGGLAGLVSVAAGIDIYRPMINFGIASGGALIYVFCSNIINYTALEDCCSIISIYLICGSVGVLMPALLGSQENLGLAVSARLMFIHLLWQFLCLIIVLLVTTILYLAIFILLYATGMLQNGFEKANHHRAKILYGRLPWKKYFDRNFMINDRDKEISPETARSTYTSV